MSWAPRRSAPAKQSRPHRRRAPNRFRFPFWAGWVVVIGVGAYLVSSRTPGSSEKATYQCGRNAYNCSDFGTRLEAQAAYLACGGPGNDVHLLDDDRDGLVCEYLPLIPWLAGF
jgi:hypothetical protein